MGAGATWAADVASEVAINMATIGIGLRMISIGNSVPFTTGTVSFWEGHYFPEGDIGDKFFVHPTARFQISFAQSFLVGYAAHKRAHRKRVDTW
jgi:hypothetical protein